MRAIVLPALTAVALAGTADAQRTVTGGSIVSDTLPSARLTFDSTLTYAGAQTIRLGVTTRAEQHFFVEADDGRIARLYWVQFEGKIEGRGRPYDYSDDPTIEHGGQRWHTNSRFYHTDGFAGRPGSDGDQAHRFLRRAGFSLGSDLGRVRLVWLLGDPPRDEVMIIYVEDLAESDLTVTELSRDPARWDVFQQELLERALAGMRSVTSDP